MKFNNIKDLRNILLKVYNGFRIKVLYKYIRLPGYLGFIIVFPGISTALSNWLSIVLMMVPVMVGIMNRIRIEEVFLIEQMGEKYLTYQKRPKRLIPNIY